MELSVDQIKNKTLSSLRRAGVTRCSLFGSVVRGELRPESDLDILVELPKQSSLLDLVRLERELKKVLGREVDLLTYGSIHPRLKDIIQKEELSIL